MIPRNFSIKEVVCRHVYDKFIVQHGWKEEDVWEFFDLRLRETLDFLRMKFGREIKVNNWSAGGSNTQRGLRCNMCELVKKKTSAYMTPHFGQGVDFDVKGLTSQEARDMIVGWADELPHPIRLEDGVNWVHLDVRVKKGHKVYLFKE